MEDDPMTRRNSFDKSRANPPEQRGKLAVVPRHSKPDKRLLAELREYDALDWHRNDVIDGLKAVLDSGGSITTAQQAALRSLLSFWRGDLNRAGPLDLDACPPGHDPEVWVISLEYRKHIEKIFEEAPLPSRKYAYAMIFERIQASNIRSNYEPWADKRGDDGLLLRGWVRLADAMLRYFVMNYLDPGDLATSSLQKLCDRVQWRTLRDTVTRRAIGGVLDRHPEAFRPERQAPTPEDVRRQVAARRRRGQR
jgi:hypothetical protein